MVARVRSLSAICFAIWKIPSSSLHLEETGIEIAHDIHKSKTSLAAHPAHETVKLEDSDGVPLTGNWAATFKPPLAMRAAHFLFTKD